VKSETAHFYSHSLAGKIPVKSWKAIRDEGIVKQDYNFSRGASSLATVLNEYYGQNFELRVLPQISNSS
jgi:predicted double-glycine peptidase